MREWIGEIAPRLIAPLAVGGVLGLLGPFGTYDLLPLLPRLGYWLAVVSFNWALTDTGIRHVERVAGDRLAAPRLSVPLLGALIVSVPATGVVVLANGLSGIGWPASVMTLYGQVLLLLCAISLPVYSWALLRDAARLTQPEAESRAPTPPEGADATGLALFLARLPRPLEGRLLCLEMQDHYLAVHTTGGTQLILCRMEDAARELVGLGRRVHRSWWVATDAVEATSRNGQRQFLRLTGGRQVPIGRTFKPELKKVGWLE